MAEKYTGYYHSCLADSTVCFHIAKERGSTGVSGGRRSISSRSMIHHIPIRDELAGKRRSRQKLTLLMIDSEFTPKAKF